MRLLPQADQAEELPRAVPVGVLVDDALAGAAAELGGLRRVVEQLAVRLHCLLGARYDEELGAGLEPPLDSLVRIRDDRCAGGGELERPARGGGVDACVRAARDAEVD